VGSAPPPAILSPADVRAAVTAVLAFLADVIAPGTGKDRCPASCERDRRDESGKQASSPGAQHGETKGQMVEKLAVHDLAILSCIACPSNAIFHHNRHVVDRCRLPGNLGKLDPGRGKRWHRSSCCIIIRARQTVTKEQAV
jgi:hypothetical protein